MASAAAQTGQVSADPVTVSQAAAKKSPGRSSFEPVAHETWYGVYNPDDYPAASTAKVGADAEPIGFRVEKVTKRADGWWTSSRMFLIKSVAWMALGELDRSDEAHLGPSGVDSFKTIFRGKVPIKGESVKTIRGQLKGEQWQITIDNQGKPLQHRTYEAVLITRVGDFEQRLGRLRHPGAKLPPSEKAIIPGIGKRRTCATQTKGQQKLSINGKTQVVSVELELRKGRKTKRFFNAAGRAVRIETDSYVAVALDKKRLMKRLSADLKSHLAGP